MYINVLIILINVVIHMYYGICFHVITASTATSYHQSSFHKVIIVNGNRGQIINVIDIAYKHPDKTAHVGEFIS